ncbi:hypothetical protein Tco_1280989 [Tanacetum coccineum]
MASIFKGIDLRCSDDYVEILEFRDSDMKREFPHWFKSNIRKLYNNNDPSCTPELFSLACEPSPTPISVNSCAVNGVRFIIHIRDQRRATQNIKICSPAENDKEMYYGQPEEILEFAYTSFKVVLFRVKWDVVVVEDDHDAIHENNSSDLALTANLNDLDFVTLNIDGQSTEVEAPPPIIPVDEDKDFIDDEDDVTHDLAYTDNEVLANSDDDDDEVVTVVYSSNEEV